MTTLVRLDLKRPHQEYRNKAGEIRPGVTTVLRELAKQQLYNWYGTEERAGILRLMHALDADGDLRTWTYSELERALPKTKEGKPKLFAISKRDRAGDIGTITHAIVDARVLGSDISPDGLDPDIFKQAQAIASRYLEKLSETPMTLIGSEVQMVSEKYQCGGTGDRFYRNADGTVVYRDMKTSGPWYDGFPYRDNIAQAAAYGAFYEELFGEPVEEYWIDRTGSTLSDRGNFHRLTETQKILGLRIFEKALAIYNDSFMLEQDCKSQRNGG